MIRKQSLVILMSAVAAVAAVSVVGCQPKKEPRRRSRAFSRR
jgi:hypothetical protein